MPRWWSGALEPTLGGINLALGVVFLGMEIANLYGTVVSYKQETKVLEGGSILSLVHLENAP